MSSLTTDEQGILFDSTSVSNAFLCEYMPIAPEHYVKVYLYGLMLVHSGSDAPENLAEAMASDLSMKPEEVNAAFRYWERNQLIERISDHPPTFRYRSVQQVYLQKSSLPQDKDYEDFSRALYAMFGDKRKIHGNESSLAFDWVEKLGLEPDLVLMLIKHLIDTRGIRFSFKEGEKEAIALKEHAISNADEAEAYFQQSGAVYRGTVSVLRKLGMRRAPSEPELELFRKWTQDWKITPDAILNACDETVKGNPNFGYLDGILNGIHQRSDGEALTARKMQKALSDSQKENEQIRLLLSTLGQKREIIDDGLRSVYRGLSDYGEELLLLAARRCSQHERTRTLDCLAELLESWSKKGLNTAEDAKRYLSDVDEIDSRIRKLAAHIGKDIACTNVNRAFMKKWTGEWSFSQEMLELAADYASEAKKSMSYMDKLLDSWHQKQISSIDAALAEHNAHTADAAASSARPPTGGKRVIEQNYQQRPITPDMDEIPPELLEEVRNL